MLVLRSLKSLGEVSGAPGTSPRLICFLARWARFTGEIQSRELAWVGDELWIVNTRFSCLCTLNENHSFVPRWQTKFIITLAAEDRCHLNGLALADGRPRYVTALA